MNTSEVKSDGIVEPLSLTTVFNLIDNSADQLYKVQKLG